MTDFSRDSFVDTQNVLNDARDRLPIPQVSPRHYVSVRLKQGVPLLDADWNEIDDIRRIELEAILAGAIGSGAPAGSDGFRLSEATVTANNFFIAPGSILVDGWILFNSFGIDYIDQPHIGATGIEPPLPMPLPDAPVARTELAYIDAWEVAVDSVADESLVNAGIGIETAIRLERVWVLRMVPIDSNADPQDPAAIPDRRSGHRYYPVARVERVAGSQITDPMLTDLRRTHLTLAELTSAPLFINDALREQQLDAARLAALFADTLAALDDVFAATPEAFVFETQVLATWSLMNIYNQLRSMVTSLHELALRDQLPQLAAMDSMRRLFDIEDRFRREVERLVLAPPEGIAAGEATGSFAEAYRLHLVDAPDNLSTMVAENDLLGAVLAQERINHEIGDRSILDGTVGLALVSITPSEPLVASVLYQLTIRLSSLLISDAGQEVVHVTAAAGLGWSLRFEGSDPATPAERLLTIENQSSVGLVLAISAPLGTAATVLELRAFPERRQQRLFRHPDIPMALGDRILGEAEITGTLTYFGPPLTPPDNSGTVPRSTAFNSGVPLPFRIVNVSSEVQTFVLTITPVGAGAGWDATANSIAIAPLNPGESRDVNVIFQSSDELGADSPQAFTLQLTQLVAGGTDVPLTSSAFTLVLVLT